jgi:hypothetical protein
MDYADLMVLGYDNGVSFKVFWVQSHVRLLSRFFYSVNDIFTSTKGKGKFGENEKYQPPLLRVYFKLYSCPLPSFSWLLGGGG